MSEGNASATPEEAEWSSKKHQSWNLYAKTNNLEFSNEVEMENYKKTFMAGMEWAIVITDPENQPNQYDI